MCTGMLHHRELSGLTDPGSESAFLEAVLVYDLQTAFNVHVLVSRYRLVIKCLGQMHAWMHVPVPDPCSSSSVKATCYSSQALCIHTEKSDIELQQLAQVRAGGGAC